MGSCAGRRTLDWLVARKTGDRAQNAALRLLLHLGLYQLFWLQRIPNHAAVHETVELGKRLGFGAQAGFLNAVLRGYTRERTATELELEQLKQTDPALGYSHPAWLVERWRARWGAAADGAITAMEQHTSAGLRPAEYSKADFAAWPRHGKRKAWNLPKRQWDWTAP